MGATYALFRACACAAACRAHWWLDTVDGRAEHLAGVLSNVLTHGQGVSQIRSKRSNPLIT
eukprot:4958750-Prymnesium_polylepis.1